MHADAQKRLKIVDYVVLAVDFGAPEDDSETSEIEGEGDVRVLHKLLPTGAGGGCAVDAADDDHGAFGLEQSGGQKVGRIAVEKIGGERRGEGRGGRLGGDDPDGGGAGGGYVGLDGGGGAEEEDARGLLVVGEAKEQAQVFGGEAADGIVLIAAREAGLERLAEGGVGVIGRGVVDDVGDELEGEWRVDAVAFALAEAAEPSDETGQQMIFVGHGS